MRRLAEWLMLLTIGVVVRIVGRQFDLETTPIWSWFAMVVAIVFLMMFLSTLVHEAAHALVIKLLGRRIFVFAATPLVLHFDPFRIEWALWIDDGEVFGLVAFDEWPERHPRSGRLLIAAAGPIATMALTMAALIGAMLCGDAGQRLHMAGSLLYALALLSLGLCVANLIPYEGSDGGVILRALRRRIA